MNNITVQIAYDCPHCKGTGVVRHPAWAEFWKLPNAKELVAAPNHEKLMDWFRERGDTFFKTHMGVVAELVPDEEMPCGECEGTKRLTKTISIAELSDLLGLVIFRNP